MRKILNRQPANLMRKTPSGSLKSIYIYFSQMSAVRTGVRAYVRIWTLRSWIVFVITRISLHRYIEVLFHIFCCNFGRAEEYRSLNRGLRYIEVR